MAVNSLDGKLVVLKAKPEKLIHGAHKFMNDQNFVDTLFTDIIDTSRITSMSYMFTRCNSLTSVPLFDTSNVKDMYCTFQYCSSLKTVPLFNTSKVIDMANMFDTCAALETVPAFDTSNVTTMAMMFNNCSNLKHIHMYGMTRSFNIWYTALEHDALVEVLNNLGTAYNTSQKVTMGSDKLGLLSDDEKAIATNKGWQLA